jgi:hypothetical protein
MHDRHTGGFYQQPKGRSGRRKLAIPRNTRRFRDCADKHFNMVIEFGALGEHRQNFHARVRGIRFSHL